MKTAAVIVFLVCLLATEVQGECCLLRPNIIASMYFETVSLLNISLLHILQLINPNLSSRAEPDSQRQVLLC